VDSALGAIMQGLKERGLDRRVNLIVVSDHGMAEVKPENYVYLDDLVDTASMEIVEWGPAMSLFPRRGSVEDLYRRLSGAHPRLRVYRKEELPESFRYGSHPRIPPIIAVADEGWTVTTRAGVAARGRRLSRGHHGYSPDVPSMRALFLARGPAFARGRVVEPFRNIHIYELLARLLDLEPASNSGHLDSVRGVLAAPD
jgi:predicted AlkP superfamily pyrophosphatase or phosphodiesterase